MCVSRFVAHVLAYTLDAGTDGERHRLFKQALHVKNWMCGSDPPPEWLIPPVKDAAKAVADGIKAATDAAGANAASAAPSDGKDTPKSVGGVKSRMVIGEFAVMHASGDVGVRLNASAGSWGAKLLLALVLKQDFKHPQKWASDFARRVVQADAKRDASETEEIEAAVTAMKRANPQLMAARTLSVLKETCGPFRRLRLHDVLLVMRYTLELCFAPVSDLVRIVRRAALPASASTSTSAASAAASAVGAAASASTSAVGAAASASASAAGVGGTGRKRVPAPPLMSWQVAEHSAEDRWSIALDCLRVRAEVAKKFRPNHNLDLLNEMRQSLNLTGLQRLSSSDATTTNGTAAKRISESFRVPVHLVHAHRDHIMKESRRAFQHLSGCNEVRHRLMRALADAHDHLRIELTALAPTALFRPELSQSLALVASWLCTLADTRRDVAPPDSAVLDVRIAERGTVEKWTVVLETRPNQAQQIPRAEAYRLAWDVAQRRRHQQLLIACAVAADPGYRQPLPSDTTHEVIDTSSSSAVTSEELQFVRTIQEAIGEKTDIDDVNAAVASKPASSSSSSSDIAKAASSKGASLKRDTSSSASATDKGDLTSSRKAAVAASSKMAETPSSSSSSSSKTTTATALPVNAGAVASVGAADFRSGLSVLASLAPVSPRISRQHNYSALAQIFPSGTLPPAGAIGPGSLPAVMAAQHPVDAETARQQLKSIATAHGLALPVSGRRLDAVASTTTSMAPSTPPKPFVMPSTPPKPLSAAAPKMMPSTPPQSLPAAAPTMDMPPSSTSGDFIVASDASTAAGAAAAATTTDSSGRGRKRSRSPTAAAPAMVEADGVSAAKRLKRTDAELSMECPISDESIAPTADRSLAAAATRLDTHDVAATSLVASEAVSTLIGMSRLAAGDGPTAPPRERTHLLEVVAGDDARVRQSPGRRALFPHDAIGAAVQPQPTSPGAKPTSPIRHTSGTLNAASTSFVHRSPTRVVTASQLATSSKHVDILGNGTSVPRSPLRVPASALASATTSVSSPSRPLPAAATLLSSSVWGPPAAVPPSSPLAPGSAPVLVTSSVLGPGAVVPPLAPASAPYW